MTSGTNLEKAKTNNCGKYLGQRSAVFFIFVFTDHFSGKYPFCVPRLADAVRLLAHNIALLRVSDVTKLYTPGCG